MARLKTRNALMCLSAALLALSACGSSDDGSSGTGGGTADVTAAKSTIAPYVGQPSEFPITEALTTKPTGKKLAYMDCGTPICGLFFTLGEPAAKALGMTMTRIKTGQAADTVSAAFDTAAEGGYDGVFVPAIAPALWERGLDALKAKDIPVVTTGVTGGDSSKIDVSQVSDTNVKEAGKLVAAYVVDKNKADVNAAVYVTPELPFNQVFADAFQDELKTLCPSCKSRIAKIPVATLGNRAPSLITDDLQANPDTKTAVFAVGEQANGLAAALKTAGLDPEIIANSPTPETLGQIQNGDIEAGLGLDLPVIAWTAVDSLARLTTGAEADPGAKADTPPMQFLTKDDLKGDVSQGWTGYPDFADRFTALWKDAS
jgi:ribose transport system substrate-binding protein